MRAGSLSLSRVAGVAVALALAGGCASTPKVLTQTDPWEGMNRSVYRFNDTIDRYALKPVAEVYEDYVPEVVRFVAGNFIANLSDVYTAANQLLQAKPLEAVQDLTRFVVNTTFGFFGIGDVASGLGLPKRYEDFGQTLGVWGVPPGPYVVLPFFGPSNLRDAPARIPDTWYGNALVFSTDDIAFRNSIFGLKVVNDRASLLQGEKVIDGVALDRYSLIRDAYLQRRQSLIYDGDPPDALPHYEDDDYDPGPTDTGASSGGGAPNGGAAVPAAPAAGAGRGADASAGASGGAGSSSGGADPTGGVGGASRGTTTGR